jgi:uncharacterized protein (UPF0332 family)
LHADLIAGFKERQKADYEGGGLPTREQAEQFIAKARSFCQQVKMFLEKEG